MARRSPRWPRPPRPRSPGLGERGRGAALPAPAAAGGCDPVDRVGEVDRGRAGRREQPRRRARARPVGVARELQRDARRRRRRRSAARRGSPGARIASATSSAPRSSSSTSSPRAAASGRAPTARRPQAQRDDRSAGAHAPMLASGLEPVLDAKRRADSARPRPRAPPARPAAGSSTPSVCWSSPDSYISVTMSQPPTSSPSTNSCGIVGQLESAESSWRMRGSGRMSTAANGVPSDCRIATVRAEKPHAGCVGCALHEQDHRVLGDRLLDRVAQGVCGLSLMGSSF